MYPSLKFCLIIFVTFSVPFLFSTVAAVDAFLYENGTCTNEKVKETSKQVINSNGTVDDFLKSLPSDNTILAQIVCQSNSNDTTLR
jgi:hypothetical protein